jgi:hypothetical protein
MKLLISATKIHFENEALVVGKKTKMSIEQGRLTS